MTTQETIIECWNKHKNEKDFLSSRLNEGREFYANMFDLFETEVLYSLIRSIKPRNIIEFSPNAGWTSFVILEACKRNALEASNYSASIKSFDLIDKSRGCDYNNNSVERKLYVGNALINVANFIDDCDFLFIDSDHRAPFAEKYCNTIIKKYKRGYIWIHDWNGYDTASEEPVTVKNYINSLSGAPISPIINLMDYYLKEMNEKTRASVHKRRLCWGGVNDTIGARGDRSPSQILYKQNSLNIEGIK